MFFTLLSQSSSWSATFFFFFFLLFGLVWVIFFVPFFFFLRSLVSVWVEQTSYIQLHWHIFQFSLHSHLIGKLTERNYWVEWWKGWEKRKTLCSYILYVSKWEIAENGASTFNISIKKENRFFHPLAHFSSHSHSMTTCTQNCIKGKMQRKILWTRTRIKTLRCDYIVRTPMWPTLSRLLPYKMGNERHTKSGQSRVGRPVTLYEIERDPLPGWKLPLQPKKTHVKISQSFIIY